MTTVCCGIPQVPPPPPPAVPCCVALSSLSPQHARIECPPQQKDRASASPAVGTYSRSSVLCFTALRHLCELTYLTEQATQFHIVALRYRFGKFGADCKQDG